MLLRRNLIERLGEARGYPLISLSGPAGSGKTSLACQWIKQEGFNIAWYSLDEEDNEPDLFFRYFLTALTQTNEQLNETIAPLLSNQSKLGHENVLPLLTESLLDMNQEIHLVLDDFHHIQNLEIITALARLIQYLPVCLHLIILSRHRLPVAMDAVTIKKERLEILDVDLKFSEEESRTLFKRVMHLTFSPEQIHDLNQYVEGWAAGLQLIGLAVRSQRQPPDVSRILNHAHEQVANYLIHDILRMQSEKVRAFVFTTVLLDRFNPALCAEVTGLEDAAKVLARLERMNLFLIPLDQKQQWYRYHQMFAEAVRRLIAAETPDLAPATLRKAAWWFAANNYLEDAMRSAFRSDDFEFAADLMEDHIHKFSEQLDHMAGLRWILKLPADILNQRPLLRLQQCHFLFILMEIAEFEEILTTVESHGSSAMMRYSGAKRTRCEDYIIYLKCILNILHARTSEQALEGHALSNKISPHNPVFLLALDMLLSAVLISKGALALAEELLAKASRQTASYEGVGKQIYFAKPRALITRYQGRLYQAEAIIKKLYQDLDKLRLGNTSIAFLLHRHLGHIFYLQNKLDKARECATSAVRYCENSGLIDEIMEGNELRLLLHHAAGENEHAAECIRRMQIFALKLGMPRVAASADACAAKIAVEQGNLAAAVLWSHRRNLRADEPFSMLFAMECLTQARILYAREKLPDALGLLETLRNRCVKRGLFELVLQIDILCCAVLHAINQKEKAATVMREALRFSETQGYIRPFVDHSVLIAPVLKRIAEELPSASLTCHLEKLFAACGIPILSSAAASGAENGGHEDLTQREIEILEWMATGHRNQEIAQNAFISLNTVKTHVRRILTKLGVSTRTQAILKAKELGIIKLESEGR